MADVVVVDDDESIAETLADVLSCEGHVVRVADNGAEGLELLSERLPDLIVLDVEMPVLTGPGMANRILIDDAGKERIPILLLSGVADLRQAATIVGTPYALPKPCNLDVFLAMTNRALTERIPPAPTRESKEEPARA